jgi:putative pre-16S rRNA nuclease
VSPSSRLSSRPALIALGFDFGLRRIGVAAGDTITQRAAPLTTIRCGDAGPDWDALARLVRTHAPHQLVVGSPYNVDGTPGDLATAADHFAAQLAARCALPVARVDERYSSQEAGAALVAQRQSGLRRHRVRKEDIDSLAAAIILERWLGHEADLAPGS